MIQNLRLCTGGSAAMTIPGVSPPGTIGHAAQNSVDGVISRQVLFMQVFLLARGAAANCAEFYSGPAVPIGLPSVRLARFIVLLCHSFKATESTEVFIGEILRPPD